MVGFDCDFCFFFYFFVIFFFFFKQKTAYEIKECDWSSDVCSSDLKKGTIVGVIVRHGSLLLPDGETVVEAGDHLIVITRHSNLAAVKKLFKSPSFFSRRDRKSVV